MTYTQRRTGKHQVCSSLREYKQNQIDGSIMIELKLSNIIFITFKQGAEGISRPLFGQWRSGVYFGKALLTPWADTGGRFLDWPRDAFTQTKTDGHPTNCDDSKRDEIEDCVLPTGSPLQLTLSTSSSSSSSSSPTRMLFTARLDSFSWEITTQQCLNQMRDTKRWEGKFAKNVININIVQNKC